MANLLSFTYQRRDGKFNPVASDCPSDDLLTQRFHLFAPQLIPEVFKLSPLPEEILSFATHVLQTTELCLIQWDQRLLKTVTAPGDDGKVFVKKPTLVTYTSLLYPLKTKKSSAKPSSTFTVQPSGLTQEHWIQSVAVPWQARLSALPQAIWLRRLGTISNQVPFTSRTAPTTSHRSARS